MASAKGSKSIKISGIPELAKAMKANGDEMKRAMAEAIFECANNVATRSFHLTPIDTGNLRSTQDLVKQKSVDQAQIRAEVSYGGPTKNGQGGANYALIQHERLDYNHPGGGQAKYLEQPFLEETAGWPASLVRLIRVQFHLKTTGST